MRDEAGTRELLERSGRRVTLIKRDRQSDRHPAWLRGDCRKSSPQERLRLMLSRPELIRWRIVTGFKYRQGHLWQHRRLPETGTFVGPSHRCDTIWVDQAAELTVQTVNARRVTLKMRTRKKPPKSRASQPRMPCAKPDPFPITRIAPRSLPPSRRPPRRRRRAPRRGRKCSSRQECAVKQISFLIGCALFLSLQTKAFSEAKTTGP